MTIHVLGALTGQGGAAGCGSQIETARHLIGSSPHEIAGALGSEHRIEHVDRHHRLAMGRIARAGSREGSQGARLSDAGVHDLTILRFAIAQHLVVVHRRVVLPIRVVDLDRGEERIHAEGASFVRKDRHDEGREILFPHEVLEQAHESHRAGNLLMP